MRAVVVIPAYNEEVTVAGVVRSVREFVSDVIVVDDGSSDATADRARSAGAEVVTHCVNRGLGAALGTGIAAAIQYRRTPGVEEELATGKHPVARGETSGVDEKTPDVEERVDVIVTMDADGQHDPEDIAALIAPIERSEADVVIGVRFSSHTPPPHAPSSSQSFLPLTLGWGARGGGAPWMRRVFNSFANLLTRVLFGVRCSDTQSGFRAFSRRAAAQIEIRTNRMEVSSEILAEAARLGLRIAEVPIRTIYTTYSLSKGQSFTTGVRTAWALLLRRLL